MILYLAALHAHSRKTLTTLPSSLNAVYIVTPHPFKEVEDFVNESQMTYRLDLAHYHKPMREGFLDYLAERPQVRAIFVGTRRTDPFAKDLKHFDPTDRGWPEFVRVHPVIDWHYANVWTVRLIFQKAISHRAMADQGDFFWNSSSGICRSRTARFTTPGSHH